MRIHLYRSLQKRAPARRGGANSRVDFEGNPQEPHSRSGDLSRSRSFPPIHTQNWTATRVASGTSRHLIINPCDADTTITRFDFGIPLLNLLCISKDPDVATYEIGGQSVTPARPRGITAQQKQFPLILD